MAALQQLFLGYSTASNPNGLLDTLGVSATAAYSTRRLRAAYSGYALKVRRSSDNTTQDIGFDGSGNLDTAALASFVSSNSAYIDTWYDQSGNGRDLVQATTTAQPRIVNAGTNEVVGNSKVGLYFSTSYSLASGSYSMNPKAYSGVLKNGTTVNKFVLLAHRATEESALRVDNSSGRKLHMYRLGTPGISLYGSTSVGQNETQPSAYAGRVEPTAQAIYRNGTSENSSATSQTMSATSGYFGMNDELTGDGRVGEAICWENVLTGANITTIYNDQKTYWGTP